MCIWFTPNSRNPLEIFSTPDDGIYPRSYKNAAVIVIKSLRESLLDMHRRHFGPKEVKGRPVDLVGQHVPREMCEMQKQHYARTK